MRPARGTIIGFCCGSIFLLALPARAQVIEPNGVQVPALSTGEVSLQAYFDTLVPPEPIDALMDASITPGTFSPLCTFQAELVLSESGAAAGLAWYNVPADPTSPPTSIYVVIAETRMVGATISSAAIRSDPNYTGGLIGFALVKNGQAVYYSESTRNVLCSGCVMPGHWKMMLAYASKLAGNTYYLAFEDWEGANATTWPNDGDFNDKVFRLVGVRCPGGGEPCDTGKLGPCAAGLTECRANAPLVCKQIVQPRPEVCDGVDNDCNGVVDDGMGICPQGQVCSRGTCVGACGRTEFVCGPTERCEDGYCVEIACAGLTCEAGKVCRRGACVAACDGITCPLPQVCLDGRCVDPCAGLTCELGRICRRGVCVEKCDCGGCPADLACHATSGACVDRGCGSVTCPAGTVCAMGSCVDPCTNAKCPGNGVCTQGQCQNTPTARDAGDGGNAGKPPVVIAGGSAGTGGTADPDASTGSGAGGAGGAGPQRRPPEDNGCSCRDARGASDPSAIRSGIFGFTAVVFALRRRRVRRHRGRRT